MVRQGVRLAGGLCLAAALCGCISSGDRDGRSLGDVLDPRVADVRRAQDACLEAAEREGFDEADTGEGEFVNDDRIRFDMRLRRNRNSFTARCVYDVERDRVALRDIDRRG